MRERERRQQRRQQQRNNVQQLQSTQERLQYLARPVSCLYYINNMLAMVIIL